MVWLKRNWATAHRSCVTENAADVLGANRRPTGFPALGKGPFKPCQWFFPRNGWWIDEPHTKLSPILERAGPSGERPPSFPDVGNRRRIAVIGGQRFQTKVVFNRAQNAVMRVELGERLGILLIGRFHHVA
jgi:hypothetical protein